MTRCGRLYLIVVGVFTDQVHASGRESCDLRLLLEGLAEKVDGPL